ncbi:MAG: hypothetical protein ACREFM_04820 [Hypericibacter sp.]
MRLHRRLAVAAAATALFFLIAGSSAGAADSTFPLPSDDRAQIEKYLGTGVIGEPIAAKPLMAADQYLPPGNKVTSYQVRESSGKTRTENHKVEATTDPMFAPGWRYSAEPVGAFFLQKTADGGVVILGSQDLEEKVLSRYTPGEPLIVTGLAPGQSRKVTVKVAVSDLSDPTDVNHTGSLDVTYSYIGAYKVTVPAGSYDAVLIKWDYKGSVGPASIKLTEYRFIAPGAGMVAMVESRQISAMLIYNDKTKLGKLMQTKP